MSSAPHLRRVRSKILIDGINILQMFIEIVSLCGDDDIYHDSSSGLNAHSTRLVACTGSPWIL